jgi:hypothetical protein
MSLKKICCVVAADNIPKAILQQPDYRELLHRSLPLAKQVKLFDEYRVYYPNGHLERRMIYNTSRETTLELVYAPDGHLTKCQFTVIGKSTLAFAFNPDGSVKVVNFYNPSGCGFQLLQVDNWISFTPKYLGEFHGIARHNLRSSTFCTVYENGRNLGSITCDRILD